MRKLNTGSVKAALSILLASGLTACGGANDDGIDDRLAASSNVQLEAQATITADAAAAAPYPLARDTDISIQVQNPALTERYLRHANGLASAAHIDDGSASLVKNDATFRVVPGLANSSCYSFRSRNFPANYLRQSDYRMRINSNDNSAQFQRDATFCTRTGLSGHGVSFESVSVPGNFIRLYNNQVWIASGAGARPSDSATSFALDASWEIANGWGWDPLTALAAPPQTWQEHWFEHNQLLNRTYYNDDVAVYFDADMDRAQTWMNTYLTDVWRYTKRTYGDFGNDRLFAVFHNRKYSGGHPSTRFDSSHDNRNVIDVGPGPWTDPNDLDMITHEVSHIVELGSKGAHGSPAFNLWGDSKWAEIFIYDIYRGLGLQDQATRALNLFSANTDDYPRAGAHWFKDWFLPIYNGYGQSKVLNNYFTLVARCYPRNGQDYSRNMNMGEFVHFWSGAAGVNLKPRASTAFGWTDEWNNQLIQAQKEFSCALYPR